jgi:hypothetical protein
LACDELSQQLENKMKQFKANRFEVLNDKEVGFRMIKNSVSQVTLELDQYRAKLPMFITFNDDMDTNNWEVTAKVRSVVQDFYEWLLPFPSQFEQHSNSSIDLTSQSSIDRFKIDPL